MNISGEIPDDLLERIKSHPARANRTQAEFYEYIFERFINHPESRIAVLEQNVRSLESQVGFLKQRLELTVQDLEAQVQQLAATETDAPPETPVPAPAMAHPANAPATNGSRDAVTAVNRSEDLAGDFAVVLEKGDAFETASKSFVDLTLRVVGGVADGQSFTDRVMVFPGRARTDFCKRAFGLQPADSLAERLPDITGRKVQVRRTKKQAPNGSLLMVTYYHFPPSSLPK